MGSSNPLIALLIALLLAGCVAAPGVSTSPSDTKMVSPEIDNGVSTAVTITIEENVGHSFTVTYYVVPSDLTNVEVTYRNGTTIGWNVSNRGFPLSEVENATTIVPIERSDVTMEVRVDRNESREITIRGVPTSATLVYTIRANGESVLAGAGDADCNQNGIKAHHIAIQDDELHESSTVCYPNG